MGRVKFTLVALFASLGFSQSPDRSFFVSPSTAPGDLDSMGVMIRTIADIQNVSADHQHHALVASGTIDQLMATEWLVQQLDQPSQAAVSPTPEYRMAGENGEAIRIFRLDSSTTAADLTAQVTAIRSLVGIQRLFPYNPQKAVVARASIERVDACEWLIHQLNPPTGQLPPAMSPLYPRSDRGQPEVVRVYHVDPGMSVEALTELVTAVRTITAIPTMFPVAGQRALGIRAPAADMATADWVIQELGKPVYADQPAATHAYRIPGSDDGEVRVFYLAHHGSPEDLTSLMGEMRSTADIKRVFSVSERRAMALRGRPDQMAAVEALISKFDAGDK